MESPGISGRFIRKMVYEPERLKGLFDARKPNGGANEETLLAVLTTKYKQSEYEDEWRAFAGLDDCDAKTGLYYVDFAPTILLREIIVGAHCTKPVGQCAKLVKASGKVVKPITIIKARPAFRTFTMVRQRRVGGRLAEEGEAPRSGESADTGARVSSGAGEGCEGAGGEHEPPGAARDHADV